MTVTNDTASVKKNYENTDNLVSRINLHKKYGSKNQNNNGWFDRYYFYEGYNVLELGCGTGAMWENRIESLPPNVTLTLTDFSSGMVKTVSEKYSRFQNVKTKIEDIQCIDSEDNSFDVVIANSMLYHVPDLLKAVSEVHRVLKPHGVFYASTFGENGQHRYFNKKLKEFNPEINVFDDSNYGFVLQNGKEILKTKFDNVIMYEFSDYLEVTDSDDILSYILSTVHFFDIAPDKTVGLKEFFDKQKDEFGVIKIPRQYGTFVSQK